MMSNIRSGPYETEEAVMESLSVFPKAVAEKLKPSQLPNSRWTYLQGNEDRETPPMGVLWVDWVLWRDAGNVVLK